MKPVTAPGDMGLNYFCIWLGLAPLVVMSWVSRAFAPFEGFCPLDIFHLWGVPSPSSLSIWRYGSSAVGVALLVLAILKKPFGLIFLVLEALCGIVFLFRLLGAMAW
jgi:hypothetical protein